MAVLEPLEQTPDTQAHWHELTSAALGAASRAARTHLAPLLAVAARAAAAAGDVARASYIQSVLEQHNASVYEGNLTAGVRAQVRGKGS